jgi:glycerol kinase
MSLTLASLLTRRFFAVGVGSAPSGPGEPVVPLSFLSFTNTTQLLRVHIAVAVAVAVVVAVAETVLQITTRTNPQSLLQPFRSFLFPLAPRPRRHTAAMSHFGGGIAPLTQAKEEPGSGPPSNPPSNPPSAPTSRRPSFAHMQMSGQIPGGPGSLSRRSSLASGPRPITRAEFSGPPTPSLLSRAGSPTLPLGSDEAFGGGKAWGDRKQPRHGEFIGSVDCGTT